jgi:hypothetical protein
MMAGASALAFGVASWQAFFHWLPATSNHFLSEAEAPYGKLQSLYGLVRVAGGGEMLAGVLQGALSAVVAATVFWFWYWKKPFALQAALLAAGTLLVTPYLFLYDTVILAVAAAFLLRVALATGFLPGERWALLVAAAMYFAFAFIAFPFGFMAVAMYLAVVFFSLPFGFAASAIVFGLVLRRLILAKTAA